MRRAGRGAVFLAALGALLGLGGPVRGQVPVNWQPDERVLVGPFAQVSAVASDGWSVHAATLAGLISYDPLDRRWLPPLTVEDGYPVHERPTALAAERGTQTLVLGTALGTLWRIDTGARRIERLASAPGPVQRLVAGELGSMYLLTSRGWYQLVPGGLFAEPAREPAEARVRPDPRLDALQARLGLDPRMRRWRITGVAPGRRQDEYFVGTAGGGLMRVDALTQEVEPLPYGLGSEGVSAVAVHGDTVWFGGDGTTRGGVNLAFADTALQQWSWPGTGADPLPRSAIAAITRFGGATWVAAGDGLFRRAPDGRWERLDARDGLPGSRATTLLVADSVLWVGTDRGACAWLGSGCSAPLLPGVAIRAIAACQGALWLGTDRGLFRAVPGESPRPVEAPELRSNAVPALACMADSLVAATPQRVLVGGAGEWRVEPEAGARGRVRALLVHQGTLWVGSDGGVARRGAGPAQWTYYTAPGDVPVTPVWSLAAGGGYLWLGTPGGALRLDVPDR